MATESLISGDSLRSSGPSDPRDPYFQLAVLEKSPQFPETQNWTQNENQNHPQLHHPTDIGNAARETETYLKWVARTMEEFFRQGDLEREKNLPVSTFFDREATSIPKCQMGYMDVLVLPLFTVLGQLIPEVADVCLENLETNRRYVAKMTRITEGDEGGADRAAGTGNGVVKTTTTFGRAMGALKGQAVFGRFFGKPKKTAAEEYKED